MTQVSLFYALAGLASVSFLASLLFFADFITNQRAGCGTTNGSKCAAKHGITSHTTQNSTGSGTDLGIARIACATGQGDERSGYDGHQEFRVHFVYL